MKTRQEHILKPTRGNDRPSHIIFFDCETYPTTKDDQTFTHHLKIGVAVHWRKADTKRDETLSERVFKRPAEFIRFVNEICQPKRTVYIVAHNIDYDMTIVKFISSMTRLGWTLHTFYSKGVVTIYRWSKGSARIVCMDNMNLFAGKLEYWGKIFNLPKLHVDFGTVTDQELLEYCRVDVNIMVTAWKSWYAFLDKHELGSFKITVGATALSAWRHRFMSAKVHIHNNHDALKLERESYHGGRTECFYIGKLSGEPYYYLDVNNMYGYILRNYKFPCGLWKVSDEGTPSRLLRKLKNCSVIAKVSVNIDEPVFPVRYKDYTIYPVGRFITTLTTPELILAIQKGWLLDVYAMSWYRNSNLFTEFIDYFHRLRVEYRNEGNDGYSQIAKLMMNSLYGKFGQTGFEQRLMGKTGKYISTTMDVIHAQTYEHSRIISLGGNVYHEKYTGESSNSFPAIAAHVTAYARLYLWDLFKEAGKGNVFYCDTDSLIVNQSGYENLAYRVNPDKLGYLKVEYQSNNLEIRAPKDYTIGDRVRIKGISKDATFIDENTVSQYRWGHLASRIKANDLDHYTLTRITKTLKRAVRSGVLLSSGRVEPFVLDQPRAVLPFEVVTEAVQHE